MKVLFSMTRMSCALDDVAVLIAVLQIKQASQYIADLTLAVHSQFRGRDKIQNLTFRALKLLEDHTEMIVLSYALQKSPGIV